MIVVVVVVVVVVECCCFLINIIVELRGDWPVRFLLVFTVHLEHNASFLVRKRSPAKTRSLLHRPFASVKIFFRFFFFRKIVVFWPCLVPLCALFST